MKLNIKKKLSAGYLIWLKLAAKLLQRFNCYTNIRVRCGVVRLVSKDIFDSYYGVVIRSKDLWSLDGRRRGPSFENLTLPKRFKRMSLADDYLYVADLTDVDAYVLIDSLDLDQDDALVFTISAVSYIVFKDGDTIRHQIIAMCD